jgi:DNA-binding NtrC family response regulator
MGVTKMAVSKAFSVLVQRLSVASRSESPVLLVGETGTGKRQAATSLHRSSSRGQARFVTINCIGITDDRFELELCGSQSSSFEMNRKGALFLAEAGTIYFHEISELSKRSQSLLLRCLESGVYSPVGGSDVIRSDVRVIASSSANITAMVESGQFRTDLFHFLAAVVIQTPSLNDRLEDIPKLAQAMIDEISPGSGIHLSEDGLYQLMQHSFSGNLVELRNIIFRALSQLQISDGNALVVSDDNVRRALSATGVAGSRNAAADEQAMAVDYMPADVGTENPPSGLQLGAKKVGRWSQGDGDAISASEQVTLSRELDHPAPIGEFETVNEEMAADSPAVGAPLPQFEQPSIGKPSSVAGSNFRSLKDQERDYLLQLLEKCGGDKRAAAKIAGVTLRTLYRKLEGLAD